MAAAFEILFVMALFVPPLTLVVVLLAMAFVPRRLMAKRVVHAHAA